MDFEGWGWSFGAEHEWADFDITKPLPDGHVHNKKDHTVVNSNGIANDPHGKTWKFGGEINTHPSTIDAQADAIGKLRKVLTANVNYRSNLHIHIRVPGLKDDLTKLKMVQQYIHENMPRALPIIEPIPKPTPFEYKSADQYEGALKRWKRRKVSHHTFLSAKRLKHQLEAETVREFYEREVPATADGKRVLWHLQPRTCVSLRQMLDTDTVEFRHWPGTLDEDEMFNCMAWCGAFLYHALRGNKIDPHLKWARKTRFPKFPPYIHWMEQRYRMTCHDGTLTREQILDNIRKILEEDNNV